MKACGETVSRSATQPYGARGLAPLWTAIFVVKEASSRVMIPPTRQGPCSGIAREGSTPGVTAKTSGLLSAGTPEERSRLRRRTWASARQSPRARRRWRNLVNSAGRGRGAELLRGGLGCQPGFTGADGVANRRKSFSERLVPSPPARITDLGVVRPETDAPHGVERAGFSQNFSASAQEVVFHGRVL